MTISVSARKTDGTFSYEVHNGFDLIEAGNGYPTQRDAEVAGRVCYHQLHDSNFVWGKNFVQNDYMSLDEILNEI